MAGNFVEPAAARMPTGVRTALQVHILFFGMLKEVVGRERDALEMPEGARVSDLLERYAVNSPALAPYYKAMAVALNHEYSNPQAALHEGDVVALIPPVSGGLDPARSRGPAQRKGAGDSQGAASDQQAANLPGPSSQVSEGSRASQVSQVSQASQVTRASSVPQASQASRVPRASLVREPIASAKIVADIKRPEDGAVAVFEGVVRNHSRNRRTLYLDYEAYEAMALRQLEKLAEGALIQFPIREVAVVHRLGRLEIGETSVLIVVASAHRAAAFEACRWLIDTLKKTVPIWKKEYFEDGAVWADGEAFPEDVSKAR